MSLKYTPVNEIASIVKDARDAFRSGKTLPVSFRKAQLMNLYKFVKTHEQEISEAVNKDLHKHSSEAFLTELAMIHNDIALMHDNLEEWLKPEFVDAAIINKFDKPQIRRDPLGVVLIIGAWNYPVQLTLVPLVGAIAGGNCAVIKPSELSENTASLLAKLLPQYLDAQCFKVINGAADETTKLLEQRFDHILYTGGGAVGRIIASAAAKFLTPVTLELGGKSPCIVDSDVDIDVAARRIAWGRFMNAGQTCVAPDYILAPKAIQDKLVAAMKKAIVEFYGEKPQESECYGRIVNARHFKRLSALLEGKGAGKIVIGGERDEKDLFIAPTVVSEPSLDAPIMQDEIFGPILPIITADTIDDAINFVLDREKPLALYVFSNKKAVTDKVLNRTMSGGAVANDTLMHTAVDTLPFGGVGCSGYGAYHGKHSFDLFTHKKGLLQKDLGMEFANAIRYPPYTPKKLGWLKWLAVKTPGKTSSLRSLLMVAAVIAAGAILYRRLQQ